MFKRCFTVICLVLYLTLGLLPSVALACAADESQMYFFEGTVVHSKCGGGYGQDVEVKAISTNEPTIRDTAEWGECAGSESWGGTWISSASDPPMPYDTAPNLHFFAPGATTTPECVPNDENPEDHWDNLNNDDGGDGGNDGGDNGGDDNSGGGGNDEGSGGGDSGGGGGGDDNGNGDNNNDNNNDDDSCTEEEKICPDGSTEIDGQCYSCSLTDATVNPDTKKCEMEVEPNYKGQQVCGIETEWGFARTGNNRDFFDYRIEPSNESNYEYTKENIEVLPGRSNSVIERWDLDRSLLGELGCEFTNLGLILCNEPDYFESRTYTATDPGSYDSYQELIKAMSAVDEIILTLESEANGGWSESIQTCSTFEGEDAKVESKICEQTDGSDHSGGGPDGSELDCDICERLSECNLKLEGIKQAIESFHNDANFALNSISSKLDWMEPIYKKLNDATAALTSISNKLSELLTAIGLLPQRIDDAIEDEDIWSQLNPAEGTTKSGSGEAPTALGERSEVSQGLDGVSFEVSGPLAPLTQPIYDAITVVATEIDESRQDMVRAVEGLIFEPGGDGWVDDLVEGVVEGALGGITGAITAFSTSVAALQSLLNAGTFQDIHRELVQLRLDLQGLSNQIENVFTEIQAQTPLLVSLEAILTNIRDDFKLTLDQMLVTLNKMISPGANPTYQAMEAQFELMVAALNTQADRLDNLVTQMTGIEFRPEITVEAPAAPEVVVNVPETVVNVPAPEVTVEAPDIKIPDYSAELQAISNSIAQLSTDLQNQEPTPIDLAETNEKLDRVVIKLEELKTAEAPENQQITDLVTAITNQQSSIDILIDEMRNDPDAPVDVTAIVEGLNEVNTSITNLTFPEPNITVEAPEVTVQPPEVVVQAPDPVVVPAPEVNVTVEAPDPVVVPAPEVDVLVDLQPVVDELVNIRTWIQGGLATLLNQNQASTEQKMDELKQEIQTLINELRSGVDINQAISINERLVKIADEIRLLRQDSSTNNPDVVAELEELQITNNEINTKLSELIQLMIDGQTLPPEVNVTVEAPDPVLVPAPEVTVNVPEQLPPDVVVNVPEIVIPDIIVPDIEIPPIEVPAPDLSPLEVLLQQILVAIQNICDVCLVRIEQNQQVLIDLATRILEELQRQTTELEELPKVCQEYPDGWEQGQPLPELPNDIQWCEITQEDEVCIALPEGYTEGDRLPPLEPGEEYCELPVEEEECEEKPFDWFEGMPAPDGKEWCEDENPVLACPVNLWEVPAFHEHLYLGAINKFPLDIVGTWPAPITDDQLKLAFFNYEQDVSWLVDSVEVLKYPVWLGFIIWVIVTL